MSRWDRERRAAETVIAVCVVLVVVIVTLIR